MLEETEQDQGVEELGGTGTRNIILKVREWMGEESLREEQTSPEVSTTKDSLEFSPGLEALSDDTTKASEVDESKPSD